MLRVLIPVGLLLATSNCASVVTVAESGDFDVVPDKRLETGVAYYLPKNYVRITFVRASRDLGDVTKAYVAARLAAAGAQAKAAFAQSAFEDADRLAIAAPPQAAADLRKAADLKKIAADAARKEFADAQKAARTAEQAFARALAAGRIRPATADSIVVSVEPAVADTRYRFTIRGVHHATQDSHFNFAVTDKGLLQLAVSKVADRLPEIASNISRAIIAASSGFPPGPPAPAAAGIKDLVMDPLSADAARSELARLVDVNEASSPDRGEQMRGRVVTIDQAPEKKDEKPAGPQELQANRRSRYTNITSDCGLRVNVGAPTEATWLIDPARYSSVLSVNCELQKLGSNLRVRVLRWPDARRSAGRHESRLRPTAHDGIVYRAPTDYKVGIIELRKPAAARNRLATAAELLAILKEENNFVLPNGGPIRTLPFRYSVCSIAGYQVQFVDGMPVRQQIDHRSELAACSAIPLQIISDIIEAPINMFDFQTKRLQKEKGLIDARRQLDESRRLPGAANP